MEQNKDGTPRSSDAAEGPRRSSRLQERQVLCAILADPNVPTTADVNLVPAEARAESSQEMPAEAKAESSQEVAAEAKAEGSQEVPAEAKAQSSQEVAVAAAPASAVDHTSIIDALVAQVEQKNAAAKSVRRPEVVVVHDIETNDEQSNADEGVDEEYRKPVKTKKERHPIRRRRAGNESSIPERIEIEPGHCVGDPGSLFNDDPRLATCAADGIACLNLAMSELAPAQLESLRRAVARKPDDVDAETLLKSPQEDS